MKRYLLFFLAFIYWFNLVAQETIVPLNSRSELYQLQDKRSFRKNVAAIDTLELPFFDDFSDYFNKKFGAYFWPDTNRWVDRHAFVNDNLAKDPISVGVVTLDGVNEFGQPDNWFASNTGAPADTLTSVPINLEGKSNVILSFYYQAGGNSTYGPEFSDKLLLEFKDVDAVWTEMWATNGISDDSAFFRVMVSVDSSYHLFDGFQFRFRNYASLHSNGDFWHLDYIELDEGRTMEDTLTNDLTIVYRGESLLSEYGSMPWTHFKDDPIGNMGDKVFIRVRNGYDEDKPLDYYLEALNVDGVEDFSISDVNAFTILAEDVCGSFEQDCSDNVETDISNVYGTAVELSEDSAYFLVRKWLPATGDVRTENDTVVYVQKFFNYYAYDDGTAEVAYGLGNIDVPGEMVVKYDIKKKDTLQALQMYFDPVKWDLRNEFFQIVIYGGDSIPETLIYESDSLIPVYNIQNVFYHFPIDTLLTLEGTVFIGWRQPANEDITFTVGFDLQNDNSDKVFYNLGLGWAQSSIPGSVMIHPVLGRSYEYDPTEIKEVENLKFTVYPNPAINQLMIRSNTDVNAVSATIFDMTGRELETFNAQQVMDISSLNSGVYFLILQNEDGSMAGNARFIKQ
jgi:hypothetical protein